MSGINWELVLYYGMLTKLLLSVNQRIQSSLIPFVPRITSRFNAEFELSSSEINCSEKKTYYLQIFDSQGKIGENIQVPLKWRQLAHKRQ